MNIDKIKLHEYLTNIGQKCIYHANSVITACSFIKSQGLLSRGYAADNRLPQTEQNTDELDKKYGIWYDIFFDTKDLHELFKGPNFYGPVLFIYSIDLLLSDDIPDLWITKDNPKRWNDNQSAGDRYFSDLDAYKAARLPDPYIKMLTFRNVHKPLPFKNFLTRILLDNPRCIYHGVNFYQDAHKKLTAELQKAGMDTKLLDTRSCPYYCKCGEKYGHGPNDYFLYKMF